MNPRRRLLVAAAIALAVTLVPFGGYVGLPLLWLATWVHEAGHAAVTLLTGGGVERLEVFRDGSGRTLSTGISSTAEAGLIASAGYVTTSLVAAVLLALGRLRGAVRPALIVVGAGMLVCALLVSGDGRVIVALIGAALIALSFAGEGVRGTALDVVAVMMGVNAIRAIWVLFGPGGSVNGEPAGGDADAVARLWFGADWMWAGLWAAIALVLLAAGLWLRLRPGRAPAPQAAQPRDDLGLGL